MIYAILCDFNFVVIYVLFPPNSNSQIFRIHKNIIYSKSGEDTAHTEDNVEAVETIEAVHTVDTVEALHAVETVDLIKSALTIFSVPRELLPDH